VIPTRKEKESLVIRLAEEGKSTRDIARAAHVSLRDIGSIIRKYTGEEGAESAYPDKGMSLNSRAFKLFSDGKSLVDVAIALDMDADEVIGIHNDYLRLLNLDSLMTLYRELEDSDFNLLVYLYRQLRHEGLANRNDILNVVQMEGKLKSLNTELYETAADIGRLNHVKFNLERDVDELTKRIDEYDAILLERSQQARQF
jgi:hypothetical protein